MPMHMPPDSGGDFELAPEGAHVAICYRVIDLGTQQTEFNGEKKRQHKIMLSWELPDEKMEDGKPFSIHQRYTFSSNERATLRQHLESWRGKRFEDHEFGPGGFDIEKLIGVPCLLTILHSRKGDKTYANIGGIARLPKGTNVPLASNEGLFLSLDDFKPDVFAKLSQGLQKIITQAPEYAEAMRKRNGKGEHISDAPPHGHPASFGGGPELDDAVPFAPLRMLP